MTDNDQVFTPIRLPILIFAVFFFIFVTGGLSIAGMRVGAGAVMLVSATLIFPILLEMKTSRVAKGYWLVGFGAFIVVWHAMVVDSPTMGEATKNAFEVLVQLYTLACAGAGGSIIAAHGDRSSTDADAPSGQFTLTTDSKRILDLQKLTITLTTWVKTLCGLIAIMIAGLLIVLIR